MAKPDKTRQELSIEQLNAIDLLATGKSDREVAEVVGVSRQTVCAWRLYDPYFRAELNKRRNELAMAAGGSDALEWDSERSRGGKTPRDWLRSKGNSIEGGTSEIQLNIIAKHILRLPGA